MVSQKNTLPLAIENMDHGQIIANVFWLHVDYVSLHHGNKYIGIHNLLSPI
jgi:hypothetical protein